MNMIKELYNTVKVEILKYKRTYALALAVLAPLFISSLFTIIYFCKAEKLVKLGINGLNGMLDGSIGSTSTLLFTFFIILLTVLIHQVEHKAHALKDLFSYPVSYFSTYTSKWIVSYMLIGLSILLYVAFSLFGVWILTIKHPALFWFDSTRILFFIKQVGVITIASLLLMGIQFLIALKWSNVIVPFGVGIVGFISAVILMQGWKYVHFHPYALSTLAYHRTIGLSKVCISQNLAYSSIGFIALFIIGYFMWSKRRIV